MQAEFARHATYCARDAWGLPVQTVPVACLQEHWTHRRVRVTATKGTASTLQCKPHVSKSSATSSARHATTRKHFAHLALPTLSVPSSLAQVSANATQNTTKPTIQHVQRATILVSNVRVGPQLIARVAMRSSSESQMGLVGASAWTNTITQDRVSYA